MKKNDEDNTRTIPLAAFSPDEQATIRRILTKWGIKVEGDRVTLPFTLGELKASLAKDERDARALAA